MADQPDKPAPELVETIPSVEGGTSAIASGNAPVLYFDTAPTFGYYNHIAHFTLGVMRFMPGPSKVLSDGMIVAHVRTNMAGLASLKEAIEKIELLAQPVPEGAKN